MKRWIGLGILVIGIVAGVLQVVAFFGASGLPASRFVESNPVVVLVFLCCILIGLLVYVITRAKLTTVNLRRNRQASTQDVRAMLDFNYSDERFTLVRYERDLFVLNAAGDCRLEKTYVLTASEPEGEMTCYVETRVDDDIDRVFGELEKTCSGGTVRPGSLLRIKSANDRVDFICFSIHLKPPVHNEEHTVTMSCRLQGYFARRRVHGTRPYGYTNTPERVEIQIQF